MLILRLHIGINLVLLYCILNFIISALVFQTCICSCCCCTFIKVWRYCGLFSALLLLLNTLRGLKKKFKFWFKFVVASRKIRLEKLDNTETNHPRNAFNGWLRHPLLKIMKKSISSTFLKMVGIFNFYKLPFDIDFIVLCRLTKTCSLSKAPTRIFPHKLVMYTIINSRLLSFKFIKDVPLGARGFFFLPISWEWTSGAKVEKNGNRLTSVWYTCKCCI